MSYLKFDSGTCSRRFQRSWSKRNVFGNYVEVTPEEKKSISFYRSINLPVDIPI